MSTKPPYVRVPNWISDIVAEKKIYSALLLWIRIASHSQYNKEKNCYENAFPSYKTLSKEINFSKMQLTRLMKQLEDLGTLERISTYDRNGRQRSNQYILWCDPPEQRKIIKYQLTSINQKDYMRIHEPKALYIVDKIG